MKFLNKLKWILGISMVFLLIITTNLIDRSNFNQIRNSVVSIYDDRLVAKDYLLEMTKLIHEKEIALISADSSFFLQKNAQNNTSLNKLVDSFEKTRLSYEEENTLKNLKENITKLEQIEKTTQKDSFIRKEAHLEQIKEIKEDLRNLSKIQLEEGRRQMSISKRAMDSIELFTQVEIYFLIFLAIIVQILVMYKPKE